MQNDELRLLVQSALKSERGITDVAFTPLSNGVEKVSFYEDGVRGHFAIILDDVQHMPYFSRYLGQMAQAAIGSVKVKAAEEAAARAADASKQVKVLAA